MKPYLSALLAALLFSSALSAQAEKVALIKVSQLLASNLAKTDSGELPGHFEKAVS
jgi:hypothetical protein